MIAQNVGCCRHEFTSGTYTFTVSGVSTTSNYILMVYITNERLLNPNEQLTIGQAGFLPACASSSPNLLRSLRKLHEISRMLLQNSMMNMLSEYLSQAYLSAAYITKTSCLLLPQFLLDCCNVDPSSCSALKQKYPTLADNDNSTNPNFCYIHGNVCSRQAQLD